MFIFLNDVAVESLLCVPCNDTELSTAVRDGESMEGDTFYDNNSSLQSMQQLKYRKGEAHTNTVKFTCSEPSSLLLSPSENDDAPPLWLLRPAFHYHHHHHHHHPVTCLRNKQSLWVCKYQHASYLLGQASCCLERHSGSGSAQMIRH